MISKLKTLFWALMILVPFSIEASEKDLYDFLWLDPDKKVYVLQNKVYKKKNTFYADLNYLKSTDNAYLSSSGINLNFGYYFLEEWAFELNYTQYSNSFNDNYTNLQRINGSIPFIRKLNRTMGASAIWSPFYGKINTFNKIIYFDWSFGAGLQNIEAESNKDTVASSSTADSFNNESYVGASIKSIFKVHATKNINIGIGFNRLMYQAPGPTVKGIPGQDSWRSQTEFMIGIGISF